MISFGCVDHFSDRWRSQRLPPRPANQRVADQRSRHPSRWRGERLVSESGCHGAERPWRRKRLSGREAHREPPGKLIAFSWPFRAAKRVGSAIGPAMPRQ